MSDPARPPPDPAPRWLPALTIWQPWATLIIAGARPVRRAEVEDLLARLRSDGEAWTTGLVVAPAAPLLERVHLAHGALPLSSILGTAVLGEPIRAGEITGLGVPPADSDRVDQHVSGWPLRQIERFDIPTPARGAQGFWRWPCERIFSDRESVANG
jgi:hypothetical protein